MVQTLLMEQMCGVCCPRPAFPCLQRSRYNQNQSQRQMNITKLRKPGIDESFAELGGTVGGCAI